METPYLQLIDGEWTKAAGGGTWEVLNPATEEVVRTVPFGGAEDCTAAIEAADRAFPAWSTATAYERADILMRAAARMKAEAEALAPTTSAECGKPLAESRGEWLVAAAYFEWYAEECKRAYGHTIPSRRKDKRLLVLRQPIGVVGVITAWNFPAYNPSRSWAAALAAGCTVVARPSEFTPLTAMAMAGILHDAGLPRGVLNLVSGDAAAQGQAMLDHPRCRKISFTGSTRVGRILMEGASRTFTRLSLELGGNAPVLVMPDMDVDVIAKAAVAAKFRNAGQVCVSPQRFLVHQDLAGPLATKAAERARGLKLGSGLDPETRMGPMINARQRDRIEDLVARTRDAGATVRTGGGRPAGLDKGYFFEPTVLEGVEPGMPVFEEEAFGPVLPVTAWSDLDDAIALANQTPYGLAAYVWTHDLRNATRAYEALEFGMVGVNDWGPQAVEAPFPGWKQSGLGCESGAEGLQEYLETKLVGIGGLGA